MSDPINEISAALAAAQSEMQNPAFDNVNPHFKSKFASLAAVRKAVIPVLAKHGISLTQALTTRTAVEKDVIFFDEREVDGKKVYERSFHDVNVTWVGCIVTLYHSSGQSLTFPSFEIPAGESTPQQVCGASTYVRRYTMQAVAAVVGEEDDDAESVSRPRPASTYKAPGSPQPRPTANPAPTAQPAAKAPATATAALKNWRGRSYSEWGTLTNDAQTAAGDISTAQVKELLDLGKALGKSPPMLAREIQLNWAEALMAAGAPIVEQVWQVDAPTAAEVLTHYRAAAKALVPA